jgi:UDPglucose 6-dehydrogenase|tara:strand:- start:3928 stop:4752 length:825 start_codon:yes stop_codon:yes gene_type:complete
MKKSIGIIGNGFVGESQAFAFSPTTYVRIFDIDPLKATHTLEETLEQEFVFICLPTPMTMDGVQDISYIEKFFKSITPNDDTIFIIKSTVLPGTTQRLIDKYGYNIIFSPEFLTERTAKLDMMTQARIIFGGSEDLTKRVEELFTDRFMNRNIIHTNSTTAEYIKYMNNTFFATKVAVMNEFYRLSQQIDVDWKTALYGFAADGRVGDSHLHVPGPDGKLGYGGTCFPKDVNAIINFAKEHGVSMNAIEGGWETNVEVRPERDWEKMEGRAVSK